MHGIHKINQYIQFKELLLMKNICFSEFSVILKTSQQPQHLKLSWYTFIIIINNVTESNFLYLNPKVRNDTFIGDIIGYIKEIKKSGSVMSFRTIFN